VDPQLGEHVAAEMQKHGVKIASGVGIESIEPDGQGLTVLGSKGFRSQADVVLGAVGCRPSTSLAAEASIQTGLKQAIKVNRRMETNIPDVYPAGDCTETWHSLLKPYTYLPLGFTAHKQGRVAGENAVGGNR
jgi:NADPH-dependent 2,4-dienoyl-CoA reductase/sulfur reductase-like enzyme